ncbi:MAG: hypothetical protein ACI9B7_001834 [Oleispira sp.]|jgi:hypothetical protein
MYSEFVFSLEIIGVKNAQLQDTYLYNGSRLIVYPEEGALVSVKGKAHKRVKLDIKNSNTLYLTPGVRIADFRAKNSIITLNKYGEGEFAIGFSLLGEKHVSGKYTKPISYKVNYVD